MQSLNQIWISVKARQNYAERSTIILGEISLH